MPGRQSHLNLRFKVDGHNGIVDVAHPDTVFTRLRYPIKLAPMQQINRQTIRNKRRAIPPDLRQLFHTSVTNRLIKLPVFVKARRIAAYLAVDGECDPQMIVDHANRLGKEIYLPVLVSTRRPKLLFARYTQDMPMLKNRFGILEPQPDREQLLSAREMDIVITPLVAFDEQLNRVGMGGGFYDNTFTFHRIRKHWKHPRLIAIAYECQKITIANNNRWDVPMDMIITEQALYCRNNIKK